MGKKILLIFVRDSIIGSTLTFVMWLIWNAVSVPSDSDVKLLIALMGVVIILHIIEDSVRSVWRKKE